ncbi:MAG: hypothetical protein RSA91_00525 [Bacilli bacterium]
MHYSVEHAINRLKKDKKIELWGEEFYKMFKEGARGQVKYTCRKMGKKCYIINLFA